MKHRNRDHIAPLIVLLLLATAAVICITITVASADCMTAYKVTTPRVIDGDTVEVSVDLWPGLTQRIAVRLVGIDAPEMRGCESAQGSKATAFVLAKVAAADQIRVACVGLDKYGGRVLGQVLVDGEDLSAEVLNAGLAVKYGQPNHFCE